MRMHPALVSCAHFRIAGACGHLHRRLSLCPTVPCPGRKGHIMIIIYTFDNGETSEVEVSEEIGAVIIDSRREEASRSRMEHRHCYSLDAIAYEGIEYGESDDYSFENADRDEQISKAFSQLSDIQKKRLMMLAQGLSIREIARQEGKNYRSVYESIESARKKFLKNFY